jgi:hypothetical protein
MSLLPPVSKWHGAADVKLGKLSGASGGVADAQTFSFPTPPTQSWWGNCSHGPQQPLTERAPVPTSAGNIQRTATRPSKTASLPPHHIQLLYPWLGITFPRRRHQSSFVISSAHFPPGSSCDIRRNQAKSERATYPWRPTSCPPTHLPNFDPDLWTRARDHKRASGHKRHCPYSRSSSSTPTTANSDSQYPAVSRPAEPAPPISDEPIARMDTNMEDVGRVPAELTSSNTEPATIPTLDGWIESLMQCKQLAESDVQRLCEKVRLGFDSSFTPPLRAAWCRRAQPCSPPARLPARPSADLRARDAHRARLSARAPLVSTSANLTFCSLGTRGFARRVQCATRRMSAPCRPRPPPRRPLLID